MLQKFHPYGISFYSPSLEGWQAKPDGVVAYGLTSSSFTIVIIQHRASPYADGCRPFRAEELRVSYRLMQNCS